MGSSVSLQSGGARAAAEILADITAAGEDAEQIKTLQAEMKTRLAEIHKALSTAENEEKKDLESELAIAQGALVDVENTNNNEAEEEGNGGEGNGGEGNGGEGNGGEGNGGEGNGGESNTGATVSNFNQESTAVEPNNTTGENNEESSEKELTPEKCKELIESPPNIEDAKKKTEEEVPGFFSFLGNWKTIFESSYWQPTEDEKKRDECKAILASQAMEGESAIPAANNNDRGLGNNNFTYNENKEKAAEAGAAEAAAAAVPAPVPVAAAAGGRRSTHKNREARRRTRKVVVTESV